MQYSPKWYGKAFAAAAAGASDDRKAELLRNFIELVRKNGDTPQWAKIVVEAERALLAKEGRRKIVVESARTLLPEQRSSVMKLFTPKDVIEEALNPALIAGVRITIDGERQFDGSLARKVQQLFS